MAACGNSRSATIEGDVFLAEGLQQEVNLAGLPVHLIPDEAEIDSVLVGLCPAPGGAPAPAAARERAWRERARVLRERSQETATTDAEAHFVLDSIKPGRYRLWADSTVGDAHWTWLQRLTVRAGDTARVDLSNANSDEDPFRCRV